LIITGKYFIIASMSAEFGSKIPLEDERFLCEMYGTSIVAVRQLLREGVAPNHLADVLDVRDALTTVNEDRILRTRTESRPTLAMLSAVYRITGGNIETLEDLVARSLVADNPIRAFEVNARRYHANPRFVIR
jgi:hypothetical protein